VPKISLRGMNESRPKNSPIPSFRSGTQQVFVILFHFIFLSFSDKHQNRLGVFLLVRLSNPLAAALTKESKKKSTGSFIWKNVTFLYYSARLLFLELLLLLLLVTGI
jgi:hypothetical protein